MIPKMLPVAGGLSEAQQQSWDLHSLKVSRFTELHSQHSKILRDA